MLSKISARGFTIVELIVVIVIIAILATLTAFGFSTIKNKALDKEYQTKVMTIVNGLEKYFDKNGEYPTNVQLNPDNKNVITDFTAISNIIPGTEPSDFISSDGHSFMPVCPTGSGTCMAFSWPNWENVSSKQFLYMSHFTTTAPGAYSYIGTSQPSDHPLGWGCTVRTFYDDPGFVIAWYSNDRKVWDFYQSKHGVKEIYNNGSGPTQPGQTCSFTDP